MRKSFIKPREKHTVSNSLKIWSTLYLILFLLVLTIFLILDSQKTLLEQENKKIIAKITNIKHIDSVKLSNIKALNSFTELESDYKNNMNQLSEQIEHDLNLIPKSILLILYNINQNNVKFIGKVFKNRENIDYEAMRSKFLKRYSKSVFRLKSLPNSFNILTVTNHRN